jgi:hypothetical protein
MNPKEHAPLTQTANTQAFMERDLSEQVEWLAHLARSYGYADLDDLFGRAPAVYTQLAVTWRQTHPLNAMA